MAIRASVCSTLLKHFRSKDDFLLRLVTVDETWVHYYEPENKSQLSVGRALVPEAKEVQDATICWQDDGHSILGCKRRTKTGVYYANLLDQLRTAIHETAKVNSLKVFCCNRTTRESTLAKLQWML